VYCSLVWGVSFVVARVALAELSPLALALLRYAAAALLFGPAALIYAWRGKTPAWRDLPLLAGLGLAAVAAYFWIQFTALSLTSAVNVALLVATAPVLTALLGRWWLREELSPARRAGIALGIAGAFLVITGGRMTLGASPADLLGGLLALTNAALWALYTVCGRRLVARHPPLLVTAYVGLFGLAFLAPAAFASGGYPPLASLSGRTWAAVMFLGLLCSGVGYFLWYWALSRMEAARAAAFMYLNPLVTALAGWVMLGEIPRMATVIGGLVTIGGVYLTNRRVPHQPASVRCALRRPAAE
jgi:drug/metabolite transporter (DMT)-like permease